MLWNAWLLTPPPLLMVGHRVSEQWFPLRCCTRGEEERCHIIADLPTSAPFVRQQLRIRQHHHQPQPLQPVPWHVICKSFQLFKLISDWINFFQIEKSAILVVAFLQALPTLRISISCRQHVPSVHENNIPTQVKD